MKCPECGMNIPNSAKRCPYCRQPIDATQQLFGLINQTVDDYKKGAEKGREFASNSGCMVFIPLIVAIASSAYFLVISLI